MAARSSTPASAAVLRPQDYRLLAELRRMAAMLRTVLASLEG